MIGHVRGDDWLDNRFVPSPYLEVRCGRDVEMKKLECSHEVQDHLSDRDSSRSLRIIALSYTAIPSLWMSCSRSSWSKESWVQSSHGSSDKPTRISRAAPCNVWAQFSECVENAKHNKLMRADKSEVVDFNWTSESDNLMLDDVVSGQKAMWDNSCRH